MQRGPRRSRRVRRNAPYRQPRHRRSAAVARAPRRRRLRDQNQTSARASGASYRRRAADRQADKKAPRARVFSCHEVGYRPPHPFITSYRSWACGARQRRAGGALGLSRKHFFINVPCGTGSGLPSVLTRLQDTPGGARANRATTEQQGRLVHGGLSWRAAYPNIGGNPTLKIVWLSPLRGLPLNGVAKTRAQPAAANRDQARAQVAAPFRNDSIRSKRRIERSEAGRPSLNECFAGRLISHAAAPLTSRITVVNRRSPIADIAPAAASARRRGAPPPPNISAYAMHDRIGRPDALRIGHAASTVPGRRTAREGEARGVKPADIAEGAAVAHAVINARRIERQRALTR